MGALGAHAGAPGAGSCEGLWGPCPQWCTTQPPVAGSPRPTHPGKPAPAPPQTGAPPTCLERASVPLETVQGRLTGSAWWRRPLLMCSLGLGPQLLPSWCPARKHWSIPHIVPEKAACRLRSHLGWMLGPPHPWQRGPASIFLQAKRASPVPLVQDPPSQTDSVSDSSPALAKRDSHSPPCATAGPPLDSQVRRGLHPPQVLRPWEEVDQSPQGPVRGRLVRDSELHFGCPPS